VTQTLNAPGNFTYCLSAYARCSTSGSITLLRQSDSALCFLQPSWQRLVFTGQSQGTSSTLTVGFRVPAGQTVDVFGVQLEAQPGVSIYKTTFAGGGVYTNARLGDDALDITTDAPNRHSCKLTIVAAPNV
jgi:hypothetical protein